MDGDHLSFFSRTARVHTLSENDRETHIGFSGAPHCSGGLAHIPLNQDNENGDIIFSAVKKEINENPLTVGVYD